MVCCLLMNVALIDDKFCPEVAAADGIYDREAISTDEWPFFGETFFSVAFFTT